MTSREWYLSEGIFDKSETLAKWSTYISRIQELGYRGLRVTGDLTPLLLHDAEHLLDYESSSGRTLKSPFKINVTRMCNYDMHGVMALGESATHLGISRKRCYA